MAALERRWVHIDLKGMAPETDALIRSLERFLAWGINGFLFELEDMFPFKAARQSIRKDCYREDEWLRIYRFCREKNAEFVPMVQTLGHMDWLLWHPDLASLRDGPDNIYQIKPCTKEGLGLVKALIGEVMALFEGLRYFHIGGDETNITGDDPGRVYLEHMLPVMNLVIQKGITPVIWSDMALNYFEIIKKLPDEVVFADWLYGNRAQLGKEPDMPRIWGESPETLGALSARKKKEFWPHIYRGVEPGGPVHRLFPYPSYFKSIERKYLVVPAAQCHRDAFTHPTLYCKLDNARAYCREGFENNALGAINSEWIVRRVPREQTMLCHYGFARIASEINNPPSNREIIRDYWDAIRPGAGEKAADLFHRIGEAHGCFYNETKPIGHSLDSTRWKIASLQERVLNPQYRPGDLKEGDDLVRGNQDLVEAGMKIAELCGALINDAGEERKAEVEGWRLGGMQISFRARLWLLLRDSQRGKDTVAEAAALIEEAGNLEKQFKNAWKGRYKASDVKSEMEWRFRDAATFLKKSVLNTVL